jgi:hypothetical protein
MALREDEEPLEDEPAIEESGEEPLNAGETEGEEDGDRPVRAASGG